jgi:hypothetical protein
METAMLQRLTAVAGAAVALEEVSASKGGHLPFVYSNGSGAAGAHARLVRPAGLTATAG